MIDRATQEATFGDLDLGQVEAVSISRVGQMDIGHGDEGPHTQFADAVQIATRIRLTTRTRDDRLSPATQLNPGASDELRFRASIGGSHAETVVVTTTAVIEAMSHEVQREGGAELRLTALAISEDGQADPLEIQRGLP